MLYLLFFSRCFSLAGFATSLCFQCVIPVWLSLSAHSACNSTVVSLCFERVMPLWRLGAFSVSFQCDISLSVFSVCCATVAPHSVLLVCHSTVPSPCVCFSEAFHSAVSLSVLQCVIPLWHHPVCASVLFHCGVSLSVLSACHPIVVSPCLCFLRVIPLCCLPVCAFCVSSHCAISLSVLSVCHPTVLSPCLCFLSSHCAVSLCTVSVIPVWHLTVCAFSVVPL